MLETFDQPMLTIFEVVFSLPIMLKKNEIAMEIIVKFCDSISRKNTVISLTNIAQLTLFFACDRNHIQKIESFARSMGIIKAV